jgi:hypothetical protein
MLESQPDIEAILLVGSTAFTKKLSDWDDFDVQVFTRDQPEDRHYYEIINDGGSRHYLLGAHYFRLDKLHTPLTNVLQQKDVQVLFGKEEALRHLFVERPRRIEPIPHQIQNFKENYENYFMLLVDLFFILKRYEARNRRDATKPRLCRDAMKTIARHYYEFYGVSRPVRDRVRWRTLLAEIIQFLEERRFEDVCRNKDFVRTGIDLMSQYV